MTTPAAANEVQAILRNLSDPKFRRVVFEQKARGRAVPVTLSAKARRQLRELLEDYLDVQTAQKALARSKKSISWDDYLKKRGIK